MHTEHGACQQRYCNLQICASVVVLLAALHTIVRLLTGCSCLLHRERLLLAQNSLLTHLLGPAALYQFRIQHLLPPVQALYVCAALEVSSYRTGSSSNQRWAVAADNFKVRQMVQLLLQLLLLPTSTLNNG